MQDAATRSGASKEQMLQSIEARTGVAIGERWGLALAPGYVDALESGDIARDGEPEVTSDRGAASRGRATGCRAASGARDRSRTRSHRGVGCRNSHQCRQPPYRRARNLLAAPDRARPAADPYLFRASGCRGCAVRRHSRLVHAESDRGRHSHHRRSSSAGRPRRIRRTCVIREGKCLACRGISQESVPAARGTGSHTGRICDVAPAHGRCAGCATVADSRECLGRLHGKAR
jgi:hypothetical protein